MPYMIWYVRFVQASTKAEIAAGRSKPFFRRPSFQITWPKESNGIQDQTCITNTYPLCFIQQHCQQYWRNNVHVAYKHMDIWHMVTWKWLYGVWLYDACFDTDRVHSISMYIIYIHMTYDHICVCLSLFICVYSNIIMYLQGMKIALPAASTMDSPVRLGLEIVRVSVVAQHTGVEYTSFQDLGQLGVNKQ